MTETTEVELVRPEDMLIGPLTNKNHTCGCLVFWRERQLDWTSRGQHESACLRVFGVAATYPVDEERGVTKQDAADMYNHCLHEIGFTEGNPPLSEERLREIRRKLGTDDE